MLFSVDDDNIFPFFREFNVFSIENFQISWSVAKNVPHGETRQQSW